jgi:hypothetical protein
MDEGEGYVTILDPGGNPIAYNVLREHVAREVAEAGEWEPPCPHCGGDCHQDYIGPPPVQQYFPHAEWCELAPKRS